MRGTLGRDTNPVSRSVWPGKSSPADKAALQGIFMAFSVEICTWDRGENFTSHILSTSAAAINLSQPSFRCSLEFDVVKICEFEILFQCYHVST